MTEVMSDDPSGNRGNRSSELNYRVVTEQMLRDGTIPETAAVVLDVGRGLSPEKLARQAKERPANFRPFGIGYDEAGAPSMKCLDFVGEVVYVHFANMPGFEFIEPSSVGLEEEQVIVAFQYFKQQTGLESVERVVRLTGVGYGVHPNHRGVVDAQGNVEIPPEKPGWYLIGEQIGTLDSKSGDPEWENVGERTFPLARIVDGPLGDPATNESHRAAYGIY